MFKIALNNFKRYKLRFVFVSLTVIFGVAFSLAVLIINNSLNKTLDDFSKSIDINEQSVAIIAQYGSDEAVVSSDLIDDIKALNQPKIEEVIGQIRIDLNHDFGLSIKFETSDQTILESTQAINYSLDEVNLNYLINFSEKTYHDPFIIIEGNLPQVDNQIMISSELAQKYNLEIGSTVTITATPLLEPDSEVKLSFEVSGINQSKYNFLIDQIGVNFDNFNYQYFVLSEGSLRQLVALTDNEYTSIIVYADLDLLPTIARENPWQFDLKEHLDLDSANIDTNNYSIRLGSSGDNQIVSFFKTSTKDVIQAISYTLIFFLCLAMLVGVFVIINTFNIILIQRTKELSLLRALATSKSQLFKLVIWEALLTALMACIIGIILGLALTYLIWLGFNLFQSSLNISIHISLTSFLFPVILGVLVTLIAAILPAIKTSRLNVIAGLTQTQNLKPKSLRTRLIVGIIFLALGVMSVVSALLAVRQPEPNATTVILPTMIGFLFIFIASNTLMPFTIKLFSRLFLFIIKPIFKQAKLVILNLRRDARRSAAITNALVLGIVLIVFATIMIASFEKTITSNINQISRFDWALTNSKDNASNQVDKLDNHLNQLQTVKDINTVKLGYDANINLPETRPIFVSVMGFEAGTINDVSDFNLNSEQIQALKEGQILISSDLRTQISHTISLNQIDQLALEYMDSNDQLVTINYKVAGILEPSSEVGIFSDIFLDLNFYNLKSDEINFYMNSVEGYSDSEVLDSLKNVEDQFVDYQIEGTSLIIHQVKTAFRIILNVLRALFGLSVLVAFIGLFNSLSLSIFERYREIGILRANGMTKKQIKNMINSEAILIVIIGITVGFLLALIFSGILFYIMKILASAAEGSEIVEIYFSLPFLDIFFYYLIAVLIALIASFLPARRASKLEVVKAISHTD